MSQTLHLKRIRNLFLQTPLETHFRNDPRPLVRITLLYTTPPHPYIKPPPHIFIPLQLDIPISNI